MTRFVVFEPPERRSQAQDAVFVRDAFSIWAFLFTFLWFFYHRLWLAGAVSLALVAGFFVLDGVPGWSFATMLLEIAFGALVALEGPTLRSAKLRSRGWREAAILQADSLEEAELVYYAGRHDLAAPLGDDGPHASPSASPSGFDASPAGKAAAAAAMLLHPGSDGKVGERRLPPVIERGGPIEAGGAS